MRKFEDIEWYKHSTVLVAYNNSTLRLTWYRQIARKKDPPYKYGVSRIRSAPESASKKPEVLFYK